MISQTTAVVVDGALQLDAPLDLPNESRVRVTIEPITATQEQWKKALDALEQLSKTHPIHSGGLRFTREELHERR